MGTDFYLHFMSIFKCHLFERPGKDPAVFLVSAQADAGSLTENNVFQFLLVFFFTDHLEHIGRPSLFHKNRKTAGIQSACFHKTFNGIAKLLPGAVIYVCLQNLNLIILLFLRSVFFFLQDHCPDHSLFLSLPGNSQRPACNPFPPVFPAGSP